jgi:succinate dehydrogenase/fumarate reductase flavoprotein subunit
VTKWRRPIFTGFSMTVRTADVLVLGGGPAGAWAALAAAERGAKVILAEKGFVGTGGATAAGNTGVIYGAPLSAARAASIRRRLDVARGLADQTHIERVIDEAYQQLNALADWGYPFPNYDDGQPYRGSLRGPDYLRFMRGRLRRAGVLILDQSPALELLMSEGAVAGAAGVNRLTQKPWTVRAGAVVVATGGCAFMSNALGTNGLTGDGLLLAAEAGAILSGMEWTGQFGIAPAFASVTKGLLYFWATFSDRAGNELRREGDRYTFVARHLLDGPVYAVIDKASPRVQEGMRKGQPNMFLPFDRQGIDPFKQRFEITLRHEGTVRGVGGLVIDEACATTVPGLFAAGDATSREDLVGAATGGGGPNSTWAIASGVWSGRSAAVFARKIGRPQSRHVMPLGGVGLRPSRKADAAIAAADLIAVVQQEMLPLDKTFFRTEAKLAAALTRLDSAWCAAREHLYAGSASAAEILRAREAAAMVATARWVVVSALARRETRGLNRRLDFPQQDPALTHRLRSGGLDQVWLRHDTGWRAEQRLEARALAS